MRLGSNTSLHWMAEVILNFHKEEEFLRDFVCGRSNLSFARRYYNFI
ncbi:unnamed protein product [Moneuplotes crassus]|uniref:Uncharacterized protein n=1 Tax=Euplotes crassus TaxID=5936 RepID=A0AAD1YDE9_EUPCR|nr:unnamed protein product [Moneuplotes crassus]